MRAARARSCATLRPDAVLGGGGYVAGPVGLAAVAAAHPARADRGRQPPRPHQPAARAAARAASAWPSRSTGRDGRALPRHRAARCRRRPPTAPPRARASASRADDAVRARLRRLARRALDQRGRGRRRSPDAPFRVLHVAGRARLRRAARAARAGRRTTTCARYIDAVRRRAARRPTSCVARAGGSIFEIAAAGLPGDPRPLPARRRRPPDRQRPLDGRARAPRVVVPDAELDARAAARARSTRRRCRPAHAARRDGARRRARWPARRRARRSPARARGGARRAQGARDRRARELAERLAARGPAWSRATPCVAPSDRGRAGGCTSSASAAPG